ncbi:M23 family metallopeptidase [Lysobacter sp. TAF61]|uniref:M23 family metallopeptidase n=1 Tax=Lysobacter sp. TAF61 TaxID=3233072 RepID=UPI003F9589E6
MRLRLALALVLLVAGAAAAQQATTPQGPTPQGPDSSSQSFHGAFLPTSVPQGSLVIGLAGPDADVEYDGRRLRVSSNGTFAFGVGRDATGPLSVTISDSNGSAVHQIAVSRRDWPVENINGVPPKTVEPPPEIAARIEREQAQVTAARVRDDDRDDYAQTFVWPLQGRISGRFGNQRVYNGTPKSPHSGMDIAAPTGTPVKAPAAGVVTFAAPDLYLTGGTLLIDHGHGVSSNFLHLSRIDVKVGDRIRQGQVIGLVGATGRATGPHLHWGMNWFDVRIDPLLLLPPTQ